MPKRRRALVVCMRLGRTTASCALLGTRAIERAALQALGHARRFFAGAIGRTRDRVADVLAVGHPTPLGAPAHPPGEVGLALTVAGRLIGRASARTVDLPRLKARLRLARVA